jgi:putative membrane protein
MPMDNIVKTLVSALAFSALGLVLFSVAFLIIVKVTPFSLRKEIEDDQNTALAIIIASVILGIALIVSSAIHG